MADSFIPVLGTDEKLQTYENDVGGVYVHSEAVTPTDQNGVPFTETNRFPVNVSYSELVSRMLNTVAAAGYLIQPSTVNADYLYIMEHVAGAGPTDVGLRGIRIKLTNGNPDFGTQYNLGATCTFSNYTTDVGWTS